MSLSAISPSAEKALLGAGFARNWGNGKGGAVNEGKAMLSRTIWLCAMSGLALWLGLMRHFGGPAGMMKAWEFEVARPAVAFEFCLEKIRAENGKTEATRAERKKCFEEELRKIDAERKNWEKSLRGETGVPQGVSGMHGLQGLQGLGNQRTQRPSEEKPAASASEEKKEGAPEPKASIQANPIDPSASKEAPSPASALPGAAAAPVTPAVAPDSSNAAISAKPVGG